MRTVTPSLTAQELWIEDILHDYPGAEVELTHYGCIVYLPDGDYIEFDYPMRRGEEESIRY